MYFVNGEETNNIESFVMRVNNVTRAIDDNNNTLDEALVILMILSSDISLVDASRYVGFDVDYNLGRKGVGKLVIKYDSINRMWMITIEGTMSELCRGNNSWSKEGNRFVTDCPKSLISLLNQALRTQLSN